MRSIWLLFLATRYLVPATCIAIVGGVVGDDDDDDDNIGDGGGGNCFLFTMRGN